MKTDWTHLDKYRLQRKPYLSPVGATYGAFQIPFDGVQLRIIATSGAPPGESDAELYGGEWEHVSVHAYDAACKLERTPRWHEMAYLKDLFWNEDECVVQYHPAKKDYVNVHDFVLHLWRWTKGEFPMPPKICV